MFYNDPGKQERQSSYTPCGPAPAGHPGQVVPITDKVPIIAAPAGSQYASGSQPGVTWSQPNAPQRPRRSRTRGGAIFALICLLTVVFGVGLFSGWTFAHSANTPGGSPVNASTPSAPAGSNTNALTGAREMAIAKVEASVVEIQGTTGQGTSLGSGVIIDNQGDIVTNNHVVDGVSSIAVVLHNGSSEAARVVGTDPATDLAVIRVQPFSTMVVATLGDSSQLIVGQEVLAVGNPLGYYGSATSGVVSALNRTAQEDRGASLTGLIQISAAINPGNSGGALINLQGQVVGIPTLSAVDNETHTPANGIGFAIPSNQVQAVAAQIIGK